MEGSFWKTWLVVGALAIGGASPLPHKTLTYEEAVDIAVSTFNSKSGEGSLYRLLVASPPHEWDPLSEGNQLNFTIQETGCQLTEGGSVAKCVIKAGGVVKACMVYFLLRELPAVRSLTCEPLGGEEPKQEEEKGEEKGQPRRTKRFKKFWKKLKNSVKKRFKSLRKEPLVAPVIVPLPIRG